MQFFQVFSELLLLLHELLHGALVLPVYFRVFRQLTAKRLHFFAQFGRTFSGLLHAVLDVLVGLIPFFANFQFGRRREGAGGGPGHFRSVDAVIVPDLEPIFQYIALYNPQITQRPFKEEPVRSPIWSRQWDACHRVDFGAS